MTAARRFAEGTTVAAETSRAELERLLRRHGADQVVIGWDGPARTDTIAFRLTERQVKYTVQRPAATDDAIRYYASGKYRPDRLLAQAIDAEYRRRWRALLLIVKAKLELVASGDSSFDDEFLSRVMLADGSTVGEWAGPQLDAVYRTGGAPSLLPGTQRALGAGTSR